MSTRTEGCWGWRSHSLSKALPRSPESSCRSGRAQSPRRLQGSLRGRRVFQSRHASGAWGERDSLLPEGLSETPSSRVRGARPARRWRLRGVRVEGFDPSTPCRGWRGLPSRESSDTLPELPLRGSRSWRVEQTTRGGGACINLHYADFPYRNLS